MWFKPARQLLSKFFILSTNRSHIKTMQTHCSTSYDAIVVGVGAMGSSTLYHLSQQGAKVLGLERFKLAHNKGSSHGETRIIRLAYHESPLYVPLLQRSYALWEELQERSQKTLLTVTGGLDIGGCFQDALSAVQLHGLDHEVMTGREVNERFPGYNLPDDIQALYQPQGGILYPEECIKAHCDEARKLGATIQEDEQVVKWEAKGGAVEVTTTQGKYSCSTLILTAGAWMPALVPELQAICTVERQVVGWFEVAEGGGFDPQRFPVFVMMVPEGEFYGFPQTLSKGFKIGKYNRLVSSCLPDELDRSIQPEDESAMRSAVERYFPAANGDLLNHSACMFTHTRDGHFVIDRHPAHPQVLLCSACSGHGFKMSSVIGEILSLVALGKDPPSSLSSAMKLHCVQSARAGHLEMLGQLTLNAQHLNIESESTQKPI